MNPNNEILKRRGRPATGQAKTAAQRMQERRQRMKHGETGDRDKGGERQLTLILSLSALNALHRMAKRDGVTKKQFLDTLLRDTEDKLLKGFDDAQLEQYFSDAEKAAVVADEITGFPVIQEVPETEKAGNPAIENAPETEPEKSRIGDPAPKTENPKSGYPGVTWHKQSGQWQVNVRESGKQKSLGTSATPEEGRAKQLAYFAERDGKQS